MNVRSNETPGVLGLINTLMYPINVTSSFRKMMTKKWFPFPTLSQTRTGNSVSLICTHWGNKLSLQTVHSLPHRNRWRRACPAGAGAWLRARTGSSAHHSRPAKSNNYHFQKWMAKQKKSRLFSRLYSNLRPALTKIQFFAQTCAWI